MMVKIGIIFYLFFLFFPFVNAHMEAGEDKVINGYLVNFGYYPENIKASDSAILSFSLVNDSTQELIDTTSLFIRISSSKEIVFAGTFHTELENVMFSYKFPYADDYRIIAKFQKDEDVLMETDFNIKIKKSYNFYYYLISLLFLIIVLAYISKRKK